MEWLKPVQNPSLPRAHLPSRNNLQILILYDTQYILIWFNRLSRYINVCLNGLSAGHGITGTHGTVLLTNPSNGSSLSYEGLVHEVRHEQSFIIFK
jgi:hypothetical protein